MSTLQKWFVLMSTAIMLSVAACGGDEILDEEWSDGEDESAEVDDKDDSLNTSDLKGSMNIEVDYVGLQRFEPGTKKLIQNYFLKIGYKLRFYESDKLKVVENLACGAQSKALQNYYKTNFQHRGQKGWYYMIMADTLEGGIGGWGRLGGDTFVVSDKLIGCKTNAVKFGTTVEKCRLYTQARIIMHEFGHNLTLTHEGFEPEKSQGTHNGSTCASASFPPADRLPPTFYSPACIKHITLSPKPLL